MVSLLPMKAPGRSQAGTQDRLSNCIRARMRNPAHARDDSYPKYETRKTALLAVSFHAKLLYIQNIVYGFSMKRVVKRCTVSSFHVLG